MAKKGKHRPINNAAASEQMENRTMRKSIRGIFTTILDARFSFLFFTIMLLFLVRPFLGGITNLNILTKIFLWFILISCVWAVHEKRIHLGIALGLAALAILTDFLDILVQNTATSWASKIAGVVFLGYAVVAIFLYLSRREEVTADLIMAAASEYVLVGILFSYLYVLVDVVYPGSFSFTGSRTGWSDFFYFSFITLTTTGYGDILPVSIQARSLAMLEGLTGQLFVSIAVARLVGLYIGRKNNQ